jgi:hypothetical protein
VKHARFLQVEAIEAAAAVSEDGTCASFLAHPRLFTATGKLVSTTGELTVLNKGNAVEVGDLVDVIQDISGFWTTLVGGEGVSDPTEPNPGVVTVEITGESDCDGESFDDLGYHVFLATILSRPFGSPTEMRRERSGELTIFDPTGCMLDIEYDPEDFIGATAFVSLMYGGEIYDKKFSFAGAITNYVTVLTTDTYETLRPSDDCKPFGWVGGERVAHDDSMGPVVPNGITTFQVLLPEKGLYEIEIVFGDISEATNNQIEVLDGDTLLDTFTEMSEEGQEWTETHQYNFKSSNRPILKIRLDNAADRNTRIVSLTVLQIDPPTQWEVINRCCIAEDSA